MAFHLGIDLGTTYTAAAVERGGRVEAVTLGNRQASVPSVLFLKADGEVLVGDAANRRGITEPERLAREFKRRVGDPTPVLLGGTPFGAEALMGKLLRWTVERAMELEGGAPDAIALTHPANWGPYKVDLLHQAARQANVGVARFLTEPEAAATSYASQERVEAGSVIAVYDLGGGTFDATVLRKREDGFDILGRPEGIERLGGIDFDVAVFNHVWNSLAGTLTELDTDDPAVHAAVARLRRECVEAKEALSADTDVSIPVVLPELQTEVRLTRNEFEAMIRPALGETVVALHRAITGAGVTPDQISAVLLVGGSSRIPMVSQLLAGELGRPIAVDANPKDAICLGAAIAAAQAVGAATPESVTAVAHPAEAPAAPAMAAAAAAAATQAQPDAAAAHAPGVTPTPGTPFTPPPAKKGSKGALVAAVLGLVALLAVAGIFLLGGDDDDPEAADGSTTTEAPDETTTTEDVGTTTTAPQDYTPQVEATFVNGCFEQLSSTSPSLAAGEVQSVCECAFDEIESNIPFDEFVQLDEEAGRTGVMPDRILDVIQPCVDAVTG